MCGYNQKFTTISTREYASAGLKPDMDKSYIRLKERKNLSTKKLILILTKKMHGTRQKKNGCSFMSRVFKEKNQFN